MLKFIGAPKRVEIRHIHLDGSVLVDMEKENVKDLAKSIQEGGVVLHPSLVAKKGGKVVCGRDRILAQKRNGMKSALIQYVDGTEADFARAQVEENLCRRADNKGDLRVKLKELLSPVVAQEAIKPTNVATIAPEAKRGRPSTGKTAAVAEIARRQGVTPQAVQASIKRSRDPGPEAEEDEPEDTDPPAPSPKVSCLRMTLGLEVPEVVESAALREQKRVDRMARALQEFGAALTEHRKEHAGLDSADDKTFEDWEKQRAAMAAAIRRSRPASLCPHCKPHVHEGKLFAELTPTCAACRGTGYISEEKIDGIEKALLAEGDDAGVWVATEGKRPQWRTLIQLRGEDF